MKRWFPIVFFCLLAWAHPAHAQNSYTVTDTTDLADKNVGDGVCQTAVDTCTLRAAIQEANADPDSTTIILPEGTYTLTRQGTLEDNAIFGDLDLRTNISITGASSQTTIIQASNSDRVFHMLNGEISLQDLTLQGGHAEALLGGGIWNQTTLNIQNVIVRQNTAYEGGGIFNDGQLDLVDVSIEDNIADQGSGIFNANHLTVQNGHINNNYKLEEHSVRYGGGLYNNSVASLNGTIINGNKNMRGGGVYNNGELFLQHCVINQNQNAFGGGGIYNSGHARVYDCTISQNGVLYHPFMQPLSNGAGIYNTGELVIQMSRIQDNEIVRLGGGIYNHGHLAVVDTLIQNNEAEKAGGGVYNRGPATFINVNILDNNVTNGSGGGFGNDGGWLTINNSQIAGNEASSNGGGVDNKTYYSAEPAYIDLIQTHITNNRAIDGEGDAIYTDHRSSLKLHQSSIINHADAIYTTGALSVFNSTLSDNTQNAIQIFATNDTPVTIANSTIINNGGFGLYNESSKIQLSHSILAQNGTDCNSVVVIESLGANLVGSPEETCPILGQTSSHLPVATNPMLALQAQTTDVGTMVYPILANSPLVDAGVETCNSTYDQRNFVRSFDGDGDGTAVCDIGAYEFGVFSGLDQTTYLPIVQKGEVADAIPATGNARLSHIPEPEAVGLTMAALGASLVLGLVLLQGRNLRRE